MKRTFIFLLGCALVARAEIGAPLKTGDRIPDVTVRNERNEEVRLRDAVSARPTVLVFYRGGWCPFCTRHLQALNGIREELRAAGAQLLAISMDQPSVLKSTPDREQLGYELLSDSSGRAARAFGVAFKVEDALVSKYKTEYQIDLEAASGETHHLLPHPAVFVVEADGIIRFAHVNTDYKVRLEPEKILEAVKTGR